MKLYSFDIEFKKYKRTNPTLEDVKFIFVSGICIACKEDKYGGFYFSKYIKQIKGRFAYCAGSHSSPALYPIKDATISVTNFPKEPKLDFSKFDIEFKSHFLSITNIKQLQL